MRSTLLKHCPREEFVTHVPEVMVVVMGAVERPDVEAEAFKQKFEAPAWIWTYQRQIRRLRLLS